MLTPEQKSMRARIAALSRWAKEDPRPAALRGQAALLAKFYDATDPTLPEAERIRRAEAARRAHMQRLALASSGARGARRAAA